MGSSTSMPDYYKENAEISPTGVNLLRLSLKNIVQGSFSTGDLNNQRLPFLQFYEAFYERLDELEEDKIFQVSDYFDHDVRQQTSFLVRILRLLIDIPEALINKQDCKPTNPDREFRGFISELEHFDMDCFEHVGSALLYAVCLCDEMHTQVIEKLWTDAYSIFLEHLFVIVKRSKLRRKKFDFRRKIIIGAHDSSGSSTSEVDSDQELSIAKKRYFKLNVSTGPENPGFRAPMTFDRRQKRSFTPKAVRRLCTDHRDEQRASSQYEFEVRTPNFSRRTNRSSRSNSPRNSISDDSKGSINRPGLKRVVTPPKKHEQIIKRQRSMSCSFPLPTSILDEFFCQLPEPTSPSQSPETRFRRNHMQVIGFSRSPVRRQRSRKHLVPVESPEHRKRSL